MRARVCLDTQILIWGIKKECKAGQEHMIERTGAFLQHLQETHATILVPTVVLGELLVPLAEEGRRRRFVAAIQAGFQVIPFDGQAALHFAEIWQAKKAAGVFAQAREQHGATRHEMKADSMIVATAVAHDATILYSEDEALRTFAAGFIQVQDIPEINRQLPLKVDLA